MKICIKCKRSLPVGYFNKQRATKDGCQAYCKDCQSQGSAAYHLANAETLNAHKKKRLAMPENQQLRRERDKAYKYRNPEKSKAKNAINNGIRAGRLIRLPCEVCGEPKSEGHHPDYSKPLNVQWLCRRHHKELHRLKNAEDRLVIAQGRENIKVS